MVFPPKCWFRSKVCYKLPTQKSQATEEKSRKQTKQNKTKTQIIAASAVLLTLLTDNKHGLLMPHSQALKERLIQCTSKQIMKSREITTTLFWNK